MALMKKPHSWHTRDNVSIPSPFIRQFLHQFYLFDYFHDSVNLYIYSFTLLNDLIQAEHNTLFLFPSFLFRQLGYQKLNIIDYSMCQGIVLSGIKTELKCMYSSIVRVSALLFGSIRHFPKAFAIISLDREAIPLSRELRTVFLRQLNADLTIL